MDRKVWSTFLAALLSMLVQVSGWRETYRAAVVEYHPVIERNDEATMNKNAENYISFIEQAKKKGAHIIVFPESGLYTKITSPIPDPVDNVIPCNGTFVTTKAVKDISCASKDQKIYTVINLPEKRKCEEDDPNCPTGGYYNFNTNVVFDRKGAVIARYAKYNLFDSDSTNHPAEPEFVFFDTDFGVRFGTFICFDIIFADPPLRLVQQYGITDFVFTTYWFGELPFLTGLQAQRGWAEANNVNLLASGVDVPETGSAGSGIYNGKNGHLVQIMPERTTSKLLVADVPKIKTNENWAREIPRYSYPSNRSANFMKVHEKVEEVSEGGLKLLKNPHLHTFASEIIKGGEKFEKTICSRNNFCCDFKVTMDALMPASKNYTYRAVVRDGIRPFGSKSRGGVQVCGVVVCNGTDLADCGNREKKIPELFKFKEILIKGKFQWKNSFQMPSTLTDGEQLKPLPANRYVFTRTEKDKSVEVSLELVWPVVDLHTFAIWGRDYSRDNMPDVPESGASSAVSAPVLFTAFISFLLFVR